MALYICMCIYGFWHVHCKIGCFSSTHKGFLATAHNTVYLSMFWGSLKGILLRLVSDWDWACQCHLRETSKFKRMIWQSYSLHYPTQVLNLHIASYVFAHVSLYSCVRQEKSNLCLYLIWLSCTEFFWRMYLCLALV